jgi:hypothetical protein
MKLGRWIVVLISVANLSIGYGADDPRVMNRSLNEKGVTSIGISSGHVTTLLFPAPVSSIIGYGMTADPTSEEGWVQYAHPEGSGIVTLRILKPEMKIVYMTALIGEKLYNFELDNAPQSAALSVTLKQEESSNSNGPVSGGPAPEPVPTTLSAAYVAHQTEVTPQEVVNHRVVYHPEKLRSLLQLAKEAPLLQKTSPELYQGYEVMKANHVSDYGEVVVTVQEIHRFPNDDAVVLMGTIRNQGTHEVAWDPVAMTVGVGDRQFPTAFVDCAGKIGAGQTVNFGVIAQGDLDGGRAHLSVRNDFRVLLPAFKTDVVTTAMPTPASSPKAVVKKHRHRPKHEVEKQVIEPAPKPHWKWPWQKRVVPPLETEEDNG